MVKDFGAYVSFNDSYFKKLSLNNEYKEIIEDAVDHTLNDADNIIKREVPRPGHGTGKYYKPTGNLQRGIHKEKISNFSGILRTNVPYWVYVEYGTHAHKIKAKQGKVLVFEGHDGELVYTTEVNIPAMPANPFVRRTAKKVKPKLKEYIDTGFKERGIVR